MGKTYFFTAIWLLIWSLIAASLASATEPPFALPPKDGLSRIRTAVIYTSKGDLKFKLFPEEAPWHVANFKYRADRGFYKNTVFHILYPDYIIQGGGPKKNPSESASYSLPAEFTERHHKLGTLGMARKADMINPDRRSSGNQFHILLNEASHMDGQFTIFGELTEGGEVLESLRPGDLITDVKVFVNAG